MNEFKKLLRFARPYWKLAVFSLVMLVAMVGFDLAVPRLVGRIIDKGIRQKDLTVVMTTSAIMLCISMLSALVAVLNSISSIRVGENIARDLREAIFVKIQNFSYGNIDRFSTAKLMVRLMSDTAAVQRLFQMSLRIGTRAPLSMIGSIVLMFVTSKTLALAMMPILVVSGIVIVFFSTRLEPFFRTVQQRLDRLNTVLQENIAGARLVKAFVRGKYEADRFDTANASLAQENIHVMQLMASMSPILTLLINIGIVLVVWLGGLQTIHGNLSLGQIVAFTNYLMATLQPLTMMTQLSNNWANGLASAKRINEVLDAEPEVAELPDATSLPSPIQGEIEFDHVGFHYNDDTDMAVLEDICTRAEPGKTTAVLGATGSGKSSLVNLIPRFYDTSAGSVCIDSQNVRTLKGASILEHVSIVPQDTVLFSGTVRDNIRYGRPEATEEDVIAAATAAQAHDFIMDMPMHYDTHIEERGVNLSGGQKQRIAIARALVCKPSILILDDATSAVDVETETKIHTAIAKSAQGTTVVMVAQRISTVLNADKIIVLDKGRIAAEGRHRELLRTSPIYKEIYDSQLGAGVRHGL
jgi:ATP-binding cassette subfamily B multidrug efflux pump